MLSAVPVVLGVAAIAVVLLTIPFAMTAIDYRQRDNGLAYLLLVAGVAVWNGMFAAQLLSNDPLVQSFFLALAMVGAILAGLGFFLFATTASSTPNYLTRRDLYAAISVLAGIDIALAVTAPVHRLYWEPVATTSGFAVIDPGSGYWLHTLLLIALFGAGILLFYDTWRDRPGDGYPRTYVLAGTATVIAIVASNWLAPGGLGIDPIVAAGLTSAGWLQATRGRPLEWIRGEVA